MTVKIGDKIRVIDADPNEVFYKDGDIFYVSDVWDSGEGVDIGSVEGVDFIELYNREFEVINGDFSTSEIAERVAMASTLGFTVEELTAAVANVETATPHGKLLRTYVGYDVEGDIETEVTVGIDEATGVMYVLGMKTEVVE
jgi:hypothetical protein